jgi:hypothetical protein
VAAAREHCEQRRFPPPPCHARRSSKTARPAPEPTPCVLRRIPASQCDFGDPVRRPVGERRPGRHGARALRGAAERRRSDGRRPRVNGAARLSAGVARVAPTDVPATQPLAMPTGSCTRRSVRRRRRSRRRDAGRASRATPWSRDGSRSSGTPPAVTSAWLKPRSPGHRSTSAVTGVDERAPRGAG